MVRESSLPDNWKKKLVTYTENERCIIQLNQGVSSISSGTPLEVPKQRLHA